MTSGPGFCVSHVTFDQDSRNIPADIEGQGSAGRQPVFKCQAGFIYNLEMRDMFLACESGCQLPPGPVCVCHGNTGNLSDMCVPDTENATENLGADNDQGPKVRYLHMSTGRDAP